MSKTFSPANEQRNSHFLMYIKNKFKSLTVRDKTVTLMVDEIHLKPSLDYKGGNIVGSAHDSNEMATSAFVFMLNSIQSKFRDVVHIIPTKIMKAETLYNIMKSIIVGLEKIGFNVISIVTDNNAINGKAVSYFANPPKLSIVYPHPVQTGRPLFFLFDSVHLLKCVRNNWLGQKDEDKTMKFPQFPCVQGNTESDKIMYAPFCTLKKLYFLEEDLLLKQSYKLSLKALSPSSLEKQNVKLVLQIFNEYVVQALLNVGRKNGLSFFADVAKYIEIFLTWWNIMNVKDPFKGIRINNKFSRPLTNDVSDDRYCFLNSFLAWLDAWDSVPGCGGKLTRETMRAMKHTTHAMLEITNYCIHELNMRYILTGKFQTDNLESRFGQYRQLAGSNYNISIRQIYECEKKIRMMSVLKLCLPINDKKVILSNLDEINYENVKEDEVTEIGSCYANLDVSKEDIDMCEEVMPVIVYLAGYCCHSVLKKMKCNACRDMITCVNSGEDVLENHSYIAGINRGSLIYPDSVTANMVMYNYIVIQKLVQLPAFRNAVSQRNVATQLTLSALTDADLLFASDMCDNGHSTEKIEYMVVYSSTNAILNNYCNKVNNITTTNRLNKNVGTKRKLQTLQKWCNHNQFI